MLRTVPPHRVIRSSPGSTLGFQSRTPCLSSLPGVARTSSEAGPFPEAFTARIRNMYSVLALSSVTTYLAVSEWLFGMSFQALLNWAGRR